MTPIAAMSDEGVVLGIAGLTGAREIGRGGFAAVYRAEQPDLHREVAVKVSVAPLLDDAARGRFRRECRAIGRLSGHPNIVAVHQSGFTDGGLPYLIMDFVAGGSLEDQLRLNGPMDWRPVGAIGVKVATTLEYAHGHNVLHRDIKPANILLSQFGEPLLADFGIAWAIDHSMGSVTSSSSGTPAYAPPKTWTDQEPQPAGDVSSLGATLHALVTGGPASQAVLSNPLDVSFDGEGDMLITEYAGDRVRRVDAGSDIIATIAGSASGVAGLAGDGGRATAALLSGPGAAAAAPNGDVYFSDSANRRLRRISASGTISTVA